MLAILPESTKRALGFKVTGAFTAEDMAVLAHHIEIAIQAAGKPIGLLADLTQMDGTTWSARWHEMRFLQGHSDHIARIAILCTDKWQELTEMVLVASAFMQAETVYCDLTQLHHAWHWVKMNPADEGAALRVVYPGRGLFQNYTPEYVGL